MLFSVHTAAAQDVAEVAVATADAGVPVDATEMKRDTL